MLLACIRWRHSSCPPFLITFSKSACVLAGMVHTDHGMITSVASIEARGCALVSPHVRDAHGPLPQCTMSTGTRQAKNVTFHRIPLKISPTQPPDGGRGGPHTLTARGAA